MLTTIKNLVIIYIIMYLSASLTKELYYLFLISLF